MAVAADFHRHFLIPERPEGRPTTGGAGWTAFFPCADVFYHGKTENASVGSPVLKRKTEKRADVFRFLTLCSQLLSENTLKNR